MQPAIAYKILTAEQVTGTLERHFAGAADLHLATVDLAKAGEAVRWEPSRGGALFPHLYGRLSSDLVLSIEPIEGR